MTDPWLQFLGRLHPLVLHGPIGLLIGLGALELLGLVRRRPLPADIRAMLCWLCALAAIVSVASGLALSQEESDTQTLQLHQWLGIAVAISCLIAALLQQRGRYLAYAVALVITLGLLIPAGHLGASMTHGPNFLTEPFAQREHAPDAAPSPTPSLPGNAAADIRFTTAVLPVFKNRCSSCHNPERLKGQLNLLSLESIKKGGKHGPVLNQENPDDSELLVRLQLPLDDLDHMPPPEKPQPTAEEIRTIRDWVRSTSAVTDSAALPAAPSPPAAPVHAAASPAALPPPPAAAIDALRAGLIHVEPVSQGSPLLMIDFAAAAAATTDESLARLLSPLKANIADLALARTQITDASAPLLAQLTSLRRLNLTSTAVTDAGIASLAKHPTLEDLTLARTKITDASADALGSIPHLKRLYLWGTDFTPQGLTALSASRPELLIDSGAQPADAVVEAEPGVKFTNDAPIPGQPATPPTEALRASNTICPVSGAPINPDRVILYKGKLIAFCCEKCAAQFWLDPAKYADNIK